MAVYVDDMMAPLGRMLMCHMMADTTAELLAMADAIGVSRHHIQHPETRREHFDISKGKRELAIAAGAIPITWRQMGERAAAVRKGEAWAPPAPEGG